MSEEEVIQKFRGFDRDGNGLIDRAELNIVMKQCDPGYWTDFTLMMLFAELDQNRDGYIDYTEFVQWAYGTSGTEKVEKFRDAVARILELQVQVEACQSEKAGPVAGACPGPLSSFLEGNRGEAVAETTEAVAETTEAAAEATSAEATTENTGAVQEGKLDGKTTKQFPMLQKVLEQGHGSRNKAMDFGKMLEDAFVEIHGDYSGGLDLDELAKALNQCGLPLNKRKLEFMRDPSPNYPGCWELRDFTQFFRMIDLMAEAGM